MRRNGVLFMHEPIILGIESSCDETAAAVSRGGRQVLSNVISSQIDIHGIYGGVVPEIASRKHTEAIDGVVEKSLLDAGIAWKDLDAVAVTAGPGLVGALLVGVSYAKALAYSLHIPLVPVHHIEGHICANYIAHPTLCPPFVCLVASGGHSHIVYVESYEKYEILGRTRDDAAGEAFDKVARVLGLGYPGGPLIEKTALGGNPQAVSFPRVHLENSLDFSFSGVKTAVMNDLHKAEQKKQPVDSHDIAASFQDAVVEVLVQNTINAAEMKNAPAICLAGGVASNKRLRDKLGETAQKRGFSLYYPPGVLCTDNAAMICCAGYYQLQKGLAADLTLNAYPSIRLGESFVM